MQPEQLQRIRMLQNRMRRPSRPLVNQQSLRSIKSTDSKRMVMNVHKVQEEAEEEAREVEHIRLSQEEIKVNRKITDYFKSHKRDSSPVQSPRQTQIQNGPSTTQTRANRSPPSPQRSRSGGEDVGRDEIISLRQALRQRDQSISSYRTQIVDNMLKLHRTKRNELRQRVNYNKWRLGQFASLKSGSQNWMDGVDVKDCKEKLQGLKKEKEGLEKSKRQARRGKDVEEMEEWKTMLASQSFYLAREEAHYEDQLKRLEEEKSLHIKEYKLLYEEDCSRYGRQVAMGTHSWPLIGKYQLLGLLGRGGFSEVYKGFDTEQLQFTALKVHQFNPKWNSQAKTSYIRHAVRQNSVHKMLSNPKDNPRCHPNIVRLLDTVELDSNSFCTVLQFCQGPDLSYYMRKHKKIPEKEARLIIRQVASAIRYLHQLPQKVIHYDLKPQNILFHRGRIKITDFGLCKTTKEDTTELTSQGVGTYWYLPPECFTQEKDPKITTKVDVWSIGVIYFEMLYGEKPFGNSMSQMRILKEGIMLKAHSVTFPVGQKALVSQESKEFIKQCLQFKEQQRLDVKAVTEHRLFRPK